MSRPLAIVLQIVRALAVLVVLFGIGAAGSSFDSSTNSRGQDSGVFGNGLLALIGLKDPADGDMGPVWIGRICVLLGIASFVAITFALNRAGTVVSRTKEQPEPQTPTFSIPPRIPPREPASPPPQSRNTPLPPPPAGPSR